MKDYFIDLELELTYSLENIEKILIQGYDLDFRYLESFISDSLKYITAKEAANYIINIYSTEEYDNPPSVLVAHKAESFYLNFHKTKNNNIEVCVLPDEFREREYINCYYKHLDYSYYIRLGLKLLQKFKIKSIEAKLGYE